MAGETGSALQGIDVIWKYRLAKNETEEAAWALAYTTENGYSKSKDSNTTQTKDGAVVSVGGGETTATLTALYKIGDTKIDEMEDAYDNGDLVQVWRINTKEAGVDGDAGKYKAKYFQGRLTSFEETDTAEDNVEYSLEFGLDGNGVNGYATIDLENESVEAYKFKDTIQVVTTPEG